MRTSALYLPSNPHLLQVSSGFSGSASLELQHFIYLQKSNHQITDVLMSTKYE